MTRRSTALLSGIALAVAAALSGCVESPTEIASGTSELMQSTVVTAAEQAASGDAPAALATLDSLQTQLEEASSTGDITPERATVIQQSIDLVRADLQPPPAPSAPETAPETTVPDESGSTGDGNGGDGNGNNGNGNGNDNGKNGNGNNGNGNNGNGKDK